MATGSFDQGPSSRSCCANLEASLSDLGRRISDSIHSYSARSDEVSTALGGFKDGLIGLLSGPPDRVQMEEKGVRNSWRRSWWCSRRRLRGSRWFGLMLAMNQRDEEYYEQEDYDDYEDDDEGSEEDEEKEKEEPVNSKEQQEFFSLRQLKEQIRKTLKKQGASAFGSQSQVNEKKATNDK